MKSSKRRQAPNTENGTVPPRLTAYSARRPREYLTVKEVGLLMETARNRGRYGHRDGTMILIAYRHGLRAGELCALRCDQVDLENGLIHVRRLKKGTPSVHPLGGSEIRALRRLKREQLESRYVFLTERLAPLTTAGFRKMVGRIGDEARFTFPVHPHMLRHACGYKLAPTMARTRAPCSTTLDKKIFSTPCATRSYRWSGSNLFGKTEGKVGVLNGTGCALPGNRDSN